MTVSSLSSWSAIFWIWPSMNLKPLTGAINKSSIKNICSTHACRNRLTRHRLGRAFAALPFQTNVHEVIRRPRSSVLKRQLPFVLRRDLLHFLIELRFPVAFDQKRRVHDHAVANGFV